MLGLSPPLKWWAGLNQEVAPNISSNKNLNLALNESFSLAASGFLNKSQVFESQLSPNLHCYDGFEESTLVLVFVSCG